MDEDLKILETDNIEIVRTKNGYIVNLRPEYARNSCTVPNPRKEQLVFESIGNLNKYLEDNFGL